MHDTPAAPPGPVWPSQVTDAEALRLGRLACQLLTGDGYVDLMGPDGAGSGTLVVDVTVEDLTVDDLELLRRLFGPGISVD